MGFPILRRFGIVSDRNPSSAKELGYVRYPKRAIPAVLSWLEGFIYFLGMARALHPKPRTSFVPPNFPAEQVSFF